MSAQDQQAVAIVGGGQAGFQTAASLRELGYAGRITIYGDEPYLPYQRPPLSKTYLKDASLPEKTYLRPQRFYDEKHISVVHSARVDSIDRQAKTLRLAGGAIASWDFLVLTTGVTNRRLPAPGAERDGVVMLRGLADAHAIRPRLETARRIVIIGGGVIGLEVAALTRSLGIATDIVELGDRLAGRIGSKTLSEYFLHYHQGLGACIHLSAGVDRIEGENGKATAAVLSTGKRLPADLVLVCIGVTPNTALAETAGLDVKDGILVDANMRTSDAAILSAGDCTRFKPAYGPLPQSPLENIRLESVQNAIDQGKCAAHTIVGQLHAYDALPWFWSDQGNLKLQIAGLTAGHDHTIAKTDTVKGAMTVYCFWRGTLIGVECINRPADFMAARRVLGARKLITISQVEQPGFELKAHMA